MVNIVNDNNLSIDSSPNLTDTSDKDYEPPEEGSEEGSEEESESNKRPIIKLYINYENNADYNDDEQDMYDGYVYYDDEPFNKYDEEMYYNNDEEENNNLKYTLRTERNSSSSPKVIMTKNKGLNIKNKTIKKKKYDDIVKKYNKHEKKYFEKLSDDNKDIIFKYENDILESNEINDILNPEPLRFKFLKLDTANNNKGVLLNKLEQLNKMMPCSSEYFKLNNWISSVSKIPLGKYHNLSINKNDSNEVISNFLQNVKADIDKNIYGHNEVKDQIIRILAQWISYPEASGYVIGIQGSMGVGKTKLVKEGICNALKYPFAFISLGGASDASFLKGHSFTYEGSIYGKIVECLMKAKVMNPVFYFDELDKISNTYRGDEIVNTLIHMTDSSQNEKFTDRYFEELDLDLSKSLIIFSYNDESLINPILKDRMITIRVDGYKADEKVIIAKDYLIPELLQQYGIKKDDIIFTNEILQYIINKTEEEDGVRNLKRNINNIISWINMIRYIPKDDLNVSFPYKVTMNFCNKYCTKENNFGIMSKEVHRSLYL